MKKRILVAAALSAMVGADAALIVGGDFSGNVRGADSNNINFSHVGAGWIVKNFTWGSNGTIPGPFSGEQATSPSGTSGGRGLGQVNAVTTETGTKLKLTFDWTAALAATGDTLDLSYQVIGWKTPTAPVGSESMFTAINFRSYGVQNMVDTGNSWANFVNGSTGTFVGNSITAYGVFTGTAGTLTSADITLDLGALGLGDVSDYDYIGIKFNEGTTTAIGGGILDNVALVAIPEPATLGMVAFFGGAVFFIRRRLML